MFKPIIMFKCCFDGQRQTQQTNKWTDRQNNKQTKQISKTKTIQTNKQTNKQMDLQITNMAHDLFTYLLIYIL